MLPFHERSWEDFERAILAIAEQVDGIRSVRIYGVRGQDQKGIDLYGHDDSGKTVAYQPKRLRTFDEADLEKAVEKFDVEPRAVGATHLIICVACETDRRQMSEKLEELRRSHSDITIELYDRRRLSELLKTRPDLVGRFFGGAWADAFCAGAEWPVPRLAASDVLADALVRGPVTAVGLTEELDRCNGLATSDPAAAAARLDGVVTALTEAGFGAFAGRLRSQHAELLIVAGDVAAAINSLGALAWEHVEAGSASTDAMALSRIRELTEQYGDESGSAFVRFVDAVDDWYGQPARGLAILTERHKRLIELEHPLCASITLWLLETAIAVRDEVAVELAGLVAELVAGRAALGLHDPISVRLRTAKADTDREWTALLRDARSGRLGNAMATLVSARYGRFSARDNRPEDAEAEYQFAIHRAFTADVRAEAAACVRSLVTVRIRYGYLDSETNTLLRLAADLGESGRRLLGGTRNPLDAGAAALANNRLPQALRWYRTALRTAVIRGDINEESDAHSGLVAVLVRAGEREAAVNHAIATGADKVVKSCTPLTKYVEVSIAGPHWERAAALLVTASEADLIPDAVTSELVGAAVEAVQEPRRSFFSPHVDLSGWKLLAALGERLTSDQAGTALDLLEPAIVREPGQYRHEDDEHVSIVVDILRTQPSLQDRAARHVARIIEQGGHFADTARLAVARQLPNPPSVLIDSLKVLADGGDPSALEALDSLAVPHPGLVASAESIVQGVMIAEEPPEGTIYFGTGLPRAAQRARILDDATRTQLAEFCASLAEAAERSEVNRTEGATGVRILARGLPADVRDTLFSRMMALVRASQEPSAIDQSLLPGLHPLSTMRLDLGWGSLPREALQAAALLALTSDQCSEIVAAATELLVSRDDANVHAAATAVSFLDPKHVALDVGILLAHPAPWARQLAAALVVHRDPPLADVVMRLAADQDPSVRRTLATGLRVLALSDAGLAARAREVLTGDVHWSVRQLALASTEQQDPLEPPSQAAQ